MEPYKQEFLEYAHKIHALKFGTFNLKSGRESPYFFNAGEFFTGLSLLELGKAYAKTLKEKRYQVEICIMFGPAYKGINLVTATAIAYGLLFNKEISFCFNRKEKKDHGEGGELIGRDMDGHLVVILDDVITSGTSIREALELINNTGGIPAGICIALDRQECGTGKRSAIEELSEEHNIPIISIVNFSDLIEFCESKEELAVHVEKMKAYQHKHGVKDLM